LKLKIWIFAYLLLLVSLTLSCSSESNKTQSVTTNLTSSDQANMKEATADKLESESSAVVDKTEGLTWYIGGFEVKNNNLFLDESKDVEKIVLKVTEPVTEIKDQSDIFPLWGESAKLDTYKTVVMDEGETRKWGVGDGGSIHSRITILREKMDKVYICSSDYGLKDNIKTDITGLLKQTGISIPAINVSVMRNYDDGMLVKISDGVKEALFLTEWHRKEKAHQIVLLNSYRIIAADFLYSFENSIYIAVNNGRLYILYWSDPYKKLYQYEMPDEIRKIEDISLMYMKDRYYLFIMAYKEEHEKLSFYKVDLNLKTITEYLAVKSLKDEYPLEWSMKSDVRINRYVDKVSDVVLVEGTDGRLSGFHDHDYLYALNKYTGEKIWEFYGKYAGVTYRFSKDRKYTYLGHMVEGYIKCLETNSGKVIWKKEVGDHFEFTTVRDTIMVSSDHTIRAYRADDGELQWEKKAGEDVFLFASNDNLPVAVVSYSNGLTAYDPVSWNIEWQITRKGCDNYGISLDGHILTVPFEDIVQTIDIQTGETLKTKASSYSLISEVLSGNAVYSGMKILHSKEEEKIKCMDDRGKTLWERDYKVTTSYEHPFYYWSPDPVRIKDRLYAYFKGTMAVLDAYTGKVLYQIADYTTLSSSPVRFEDGILWFFNNLDGQMEALRVK